MTEPRIYVANLAKYNDGKLVGQWIDVPTDRDELLEAIQAIVGQDEWAIHDSEGLPKSLQSEHPDLNDLARFAELCEEHDEDLLLAAVENFNGDLDAAEKALTEHFQGTFSDLGEYAAQQAEDNGDLRDVPRYIQEFIDFDTMGKSYEDNGEIWTVDLGYKRGIAVFLNL